MKYHTTPSGFAAPVSLGMSTAGARLPHENGILHLTWRFSTPSWTRDLSFSPLLEDKRFFSFGFQSSVVRPYRLPGCRRTSRDPRVEIALVLHVSLSSLATSGCVISSNSARRTSEMEYGARTLDSESLLLFPPPFFLNSRIYPSLPPRDHFAFCHSHV